MTFKAASHINHSVIKLPNTKRPKCYCLKEMSMLFNTIWKSQLVLHSMSEHLSALENKPVCLIFPLHQRTVLSGTVAMVAPLIPWVKTSSRSAGDISSLWGYACNTKLQVVLSGNKINIFIFNRWTKQTQNQTTVFFGFCFFFFFFWIVWALLNTIQMKLNHIYLYYISYLFC